MFLNEIKSTNLKKLLRCSKSSFWLTTYSRNCAVSLNKISSLHLFKQFEVNQQADIKRNWSYNFRLKTTNCMPITEFKNNLKRVNFFLKSTPYSHLYIKPLFGHIILSSNPDLLPVIRRCFYQIPSSLFIHNTGDFSTGSKAANGQTTPQIIEKMETEKKIFWNSKQELLEDLKDTKAKVKEKVDNIIKKENIWTIPNFLCVGRIVMSPFLCYTVLSSHYSLALGMFIVAGFTDLIDGMIARAFPSQASMLGSFLDPLADKILVASLFLTLTYVGLIPLYLTGITVYRDVLIIGGASYVRYKSLPRPHTLSRYFDATHATAQLAPTLISKLNTAIQIGLITTSLAAPVFLFMDHPLLHTFWWITAGTTVSSGISYIFSNDTYKILSQK